MYTNTNYQSSNDMDDDNIHDGDDIWAAEVPDGVEEEQHDDIWAVVFAVDDIGDAPVYELVHFSVVVENDIFLDEGDAYFLFEKNILNDCFLDIPNDILCGLRGVLFARNLELQRAS